jgi:hypothetical protein
MPGLILWTGDDNPELCNSVDEILRQGLRDSGRYSDEDP